MNNDDLLDNFSPDERQHYEELIAKIEKIEGNEPINSDSPGEVTDLLLSDIAAQIEKYVVFRTPAQTTAIALWILHTHVFELFDSTPYLSINSAAKQCGKSRLFEVMALLVARPWTVVEPSEAVLFRRIHHTKPTLLLDEVDAQFSKDATMTEGIRALLNAGYRLGATIPRCVGPTQQLTDYSIYCPKAFAGIRAKLPDTVLDRSIPIELRRRAPSERMPSRFRQKRAGEEFAPLNQRIVQWSKWAADQLKDNEPDLPDELSDRQQDCWEPLFAIADLAGGDWSEKARSAAIALHVGVEDADVGVLLLAHCREVRSDLEGESIPTEELLTALVNRGDDSPWARWWSEDIERHQTKRPGSQLARTLKPYGIEPVQLWVKGSKTRGYHWPDFEDAWSRYLPKHPPTRMVGNNNGRTVDSRSEAISTQKPSKAKSALDQDSTVLPFKKPTNTVESQFSAFPEDAPPLTDDDFHGFGDDEYSHEDEADYWNEGMEA